MPSLDALSQTPSAAASETFCVEPPTGMPTRSGRPRIEQRGLDPVAHAARVEAGLQGLEEPAS